MTVHRVTGRAASPALWETISRFSAVTQTSAVAPAGYANRTTSEAALHS
jgi:hypothetical protein